MKLFADEEYTEKSRDLALQCLPRLVRQARKDKPITYGKLMEQLRRANIRVSRRTIADALGVIRDEICIPKDLPLLNTIVVRKDTKIPGDEFLPESIAKALNPKQRKYLAKRLFQDVFTHADSKDWDKLLVDLRQKPVW